MTNEAASTATKQKRSISIKVRMILMAAISLVLMLVINLVSFLGLQSIQRNQIDSGKYTKIYERLTDVIANVALLEGYQETAARYSLMRDNAKTPAEAADIQKKSDNDDADWKKLVDDTQNEIDKIVSSVRTPAGKQHAQAVAQAWADYKPTHQTMLDLSHDSSPEATANNERIAG